MLLKTLRRLRRKNRIRSKISGTNLRPRLAVFRSNTGIYAQLIDDVSCKTLAASSDLKMQKQ
jgi:large subunit ribosomal protein L18